MAKTRVRLQDSKKQVRANRSNIAALVVVTLEPTPKSFVYGPVAKQLRALLLQENLPHCPDQALVLFLPELPGPDELRDGLPKALVETMRHHRAESPTPILLHLGDAVPGFAAWRVRISPNGFVVTTDVQYLRRDEVRGEALDWVAKFQKHLKTEKLDVVRPVIDVLQVAREFAEAVLPDASRAKEIRQNLMDAQKYQPEDKREFVHTINDTLMGMRCAIQLPDGRLAMLKAMPQRSGSDKDMIVFKVIGADSVGGFGKTDVEVVPVKRGERGKIIPR